MLQLHLTALPERDRPPSPLAHAPRGFRGPIQTRHRPLLLEIVSLGHSDALVAVPWAPNRSMNLGRGPVRLRRDSDSALAERQTRGEVKKDGVQSSRRRAREYESRTRCIISHAASRIESIHFLRTVLTHASIAAHGLGLARWFDRWLPCAWWARPWAEPATGCFDPPALGGSTRGFKAAARALVD